MNQTQAISQEKVSSAVHALNGRLDAARVHQEKNEIVSTLLALNGDVMLDLEQVSFIDSTGLGLLVLLKNELAAKGRKFALCRVNTKVRMLLELTRMHQIFDIYDTPGAAQ